VRTSNHRLATLIAFGDALIQTEVRSGDVVDQNFLNSSKVSRVLLHQACADSSLGQLPQQDQHLLAFLQHVFDQLARAGTGGMGRRSWCWAWGRFLWLRKASLLLTRLSCKSTTRGRAQLAYLKDGRSIIRRWKSRLRDQTPDRPGRYGDRLSRPSSVPWAARWCSKSSIQHRHFARNGERFLNEGASSPRSIHPHIHHHLRTSVQ